MPISTVIASPLGNNRDWAENRNGQAARVQAAPALATPSVAVPMVASPPPADPVRTDNLATISSGLSTQDRYQVADQERGLSSAYQRAQRNYNSGIQSSDNDFLLAAKRSAQQLGNNRNMGLSLSADSGFGSSPAIAGARLAAAGQTYANAQAQATTDWTAARSALQRMIQEAVLTKAEGETDLTQDAARRRDYAAEIRRMGT